ncbi:hypothetical protein SH449x_000233 [Pirellulaceae bacterium SH449]
MLKFIGFRLGLLSVASLMLIVTLTVRVDAWQDEVQVEVVALDDADAAELAQAQMANPFGFEPSKMLAAKRFQLSQAFQLEIEHIQRLCEPTPQQITKLKVGSKGVVKKLSQEWWKKSGQMFGRMGQIEGNDQDSQDEDQLEEAIVEIKDASEIDDRMAQMVLLNEMGNPFKAVVPTKEKVWATLIASVLTPEQQGKLATYQAEQVNQQRSDMLQAVLGTICRELRLGADEKQKLHDAIKPHFDSAEVSGIPFFENYMGYYFAAKVSNDELAKFLSPAQIQSMRMMLWPAREIERMMAMEDQ